MGDFERSFGAGCDASHILEGYSHVPKERYKIAMVRFSKHSATYPVNCVLGVKPRAFVLVKKERQPTNLQLAEVVEAGIERYGICSHTVVCRAEKSADYGYGPEGVETLEELDHFLTKGLWYRKYPIDEAKGQWDLHGSNAPWHTAYITPRSSDSGGSVLAGNIIAVGNEKIGYAGPGYHGDGTFLCLTNGSFTKMPSLSTQFEGVDRFKKVARRAEYMLSEPI